MIIKKITELVGNTPLIQIPELVHGIPNLQLYCKLEFLNAFGSIKDRIALNMLNSHLAECKNKNKTILEASSGNTAKALALLSSINNLKFKTISNRIKTPEMKELLLLLNSDIEELPGVSECPDPNNPDDYMAVAKRLADNNPEKFFYTDQYFNEKNPEAHKITGEEIMMDLKKIDYFIGFLGTAGSSRGIGSVLKDKRKSKVIGVVAERNNYVPGGRTLDEMWEVGFYDKNFYDEIIAGTTDEAIKGMLTLIRKVGLLCGPTSGLSYQKLIEYFKNHPLKEKTSAVFIACDRVEPYFSYLEKYAPNLIGKENANSMITNMSEDELIESTEITAENLKKIIDKVVIIDIRSNQAFQMFHLPNSINIPESDIDLFFGNAVPFSKDRKIIVVCPRGLRSKKLVAFLNKNGYDSASLQKGINSYRFSMH